MGIVPVGTAQGAGVSPQNRAHDPAVRSLQDVRAVHLLGCPVISAEDADFGLLLAPGGGFAHLPLHAEQIEPSEAPAEAHLSLRQLHAELVLEGAQYRETLFQVQDGSRRGAPGRAAAVQVTALPNAARDYARTRRGIVQAQGRFKGLGDGVWVLGDAELIILRDQRRQPEIVVPEIKGIVVGAARIQIVVIEKIHGRFWSFARGHEGEATRVIRKVFVARVLLQERFVHGDVVSSVPVVFVRPANRLSGYKEQEGGALSLQKPSL